MVIAQRTWYLVFWEYWESGFVPAGHLFYQLFDLACVHSIPQESRLQTCKCRCNLLHIIDRTCDDVDYEVSKLSNLLISVYTTRMNPRKKKSQKPSLEVDFNLHVVTVATYSWHWHLTSIGDRAFQRCIILDFSHNIPYAGVSQNGHKYFLCIQIPVLL